MARLTRPGPDPAPYDYIYELGGGGATWHAPDVSGSDYAAAQSEVLGLSLDSSAGGQFSWIPQGEPGSVFDGGYVAGDACFGLALKTLVVAAYANQPQPADLHPYALWTRVGAARSYGDGYRAQFNLYGAVGMVLIGDGSIKGASYDWTGGAQSPAWRDEDNWAEYRVPGPMDRVRIDGANVEVTDGLDSLPDVRSIDLRNGAGLTISGEHAPLRSLTSLIGEDAERNTVHMLPRTTLYLGQDDQSERGSLLNVNVVMDDTTDGITHLSAVHAI